MKILNSRIAAIAVFVALLIIGCKSSDKFESRNPAEVFSRAMEFYEREKFIEARNLFEMIKLQFSATEYADNAQFYLGEIAFKRKEYVMAAFSFNQLRRVYPGSEFTKISLFKTGLSFYQLSPKFDRDQDYTRKAISAFQEFQYIYPNDSLYSIAGDYINELRTKLAYREFFTAQLYRKLDSPNSALIYYNTVINEYNDTEFAEESYFGRIEVLLQMERFDEVRSAISVYKRLYPKGKFLSNIKTIENNLR